MHRHAQDCKTRKGHGRSGTLLISRGTHEDGDQDVGLAGYAHEDVTRERFFILLYTLSAELGARPARAPRDARVATTHIETCTCISSVVCWSVVCRETIGVSSVVSFFYFSLCEI